MLDRAGTAIPEGGAMVARDQSSWPMVSAPVGPVGSVIVGSATGIGLLLALYAVFTDAALPLQARIFLIVWLTISTLAAFLITPRNFTLGFLVGLAALLIGWRVAALNSLDIVTWPLLAVFLLYVSPFFAAWRSDIASAEPVQSWPEWHLTFLRIYVGFDLVPHCTEKLFAGPAPFNADVEAFAAMHVPFPEAFVILGGFCEIAIVIGLGLGVLTRLAGIGAALYYLIASLIGGHFLNGFIWASPGGGWEYPVLMMVLFLSFVPRGAGAFSVDCWLLREGLLPPILRRLAVPSAELEVRHASN